MNWEDSTLNIILAEQSPERATMLDIAWRLEGVVVSPLPKTEFGKPLISLPPAPQETEE